ncbi:hypothetical protein ACKVV1_000047 [Pyricularia oryzae]
MSEFPFSSPSTGVFALSKPSHLFAAIALTAALLIVRRLLKPDPYANYPQWGEELGGFAKRRTYYLHNAAEVYYDAYRKFKNRICKLTTLDGDILLLPIKYADELLKLPGDIVDSYELLSSRIESKILKIKPENEYLVHVLRSDLNRQLPRLNDALADAARTSVLETLGDSEQWTEFSVYRRVMEIVAVVSGSIFIGPELCRNKEWLEIGIRFTIDLFHAATALKVYPRFLRPVAKYWCPEVFAVHRHTSKAAELLMPVIENRRGLRDKDPSIVSNDLIHWLVNKAPKWGKDTTEFLVHSELQLTMASLNNTTAAITHFLYDIAAKCPEVVPELRAEIQTALDKHGGVWSAQALFSMKLLDSVMKESQRFNPNLMITPRKILKPIEFRDGTRIPAGVNVCVAGYAALQDGDFYKDPATFDPYRFLKLRTGETEDPLQYASTEQYQYVSVTKENMIFGYGLHTCPGRFFASSAIKMICGQILLQYDVKLPDGVTERYRNLITGHFINPDTTKSLMIRKRVM